MGRPIDWRVAARNRTNSRIATLPWKGPHINIFDTLNALPQPTEPMDDLIALAQLGDKDATLKVMRAHLKILVSEHDRAVRLITRYGYAPDTMDLRQDVQADAIQVFFRVLSVYDPERSKTGRFGSLLYAALRRDEALNSAVNRVRPFRIPEPTARRRGAAIKAAGGDLTKARELAPQFNLTKAAFDAVTEVYDAGVSMNNENSPEALFGQRESGYVRIDHLQDTARALEALDFTSRLIVESAYGLNGQPEQSHAEIGKSLGLTRWAVRRRLDAAMLVMQQELNDKETDRDE